VQAAGLNLKFQPECGLLLEASTVGGARGTRHAEEKTT
jgi:hypothetical protein